MQNDLRFAKHFLFTQFSLATFESCPLKFKKRYIENLKWSSIPNKQIQKSLQLGNDFHLLANRYFLGMNTGMEICELNDHNLEEWIDNLKQWFKLSNKEVYLPEYKLRMISDELKLEANFDLLIVKKEKLEIWDWKTSSNITDFKQDLKAKKRLEGSLQTMVYMFVLKELSYLVTQFPITCEDITMHYWQPSPPKILAKISYSDEMHNRFRKIIKEKMQNILDYNFKEFEMCGQASNLQHCKYCEFIWFCSNGKQIISYSELANDSEFWEEFIENVDLENVQEIY